MRKKRPGQEHRGADWKVEAVRGLTNVLLRVIDRWHSTSVLAFLVLLITAISVLRAPDEDVGSFLNAILAVLDKVVTILLGTPSLLGFSVGLNLAAFVLLLVQWRYYRVEINRVALQKRKLEEKLDRDRPDTGLGIDGRRTNNEH